MKNKKLLITLIIIFVMVFSTGITYSMFHSSKEMTSIDRHLAKFVFEANQTDNISLDLSSIIPGVPNTYNFSVTNVKENVQSDVTVLYQITIKTFHLMPLEIELFEVNNQDEELVLTCDESYSRNANLELVCNTEMFTLEHADDLTKEYKLEVSLPIEYNSSEYANLVDYINLEISSSQKISE